MRAPLAGIVGRDALRATSAPGAGQRDGRRAAAGLRGRRGCGRSRRTADARCPISRCQRMRPTSASAPRGPRPRSPRPRPGRRRRPGRATSQAPRRGRRRDQGGEEEAGDAGGQGEAAVPAPTGADDGADPARSGPAQAPRCRGRGSPAGGAGGRRARPHGGALGPARVSAASSASSFEGRDEGVTANSSASDEHASRQSDEER